MQEFFKFSALVCIIGCLTAIAVIAENNDSVGGVNDAAAALDNVAENNTETTNWLRKATGKVKDAVKLEERKQEIKNKGEQMLDEQAPKVVEQAKQKAKALNEAHQPQNEPTSGWFHWFLLYAWYAFCSPFAFVAYVAVILFTLFWQHVMERDKYRIFSGSRAYCFILCLSAVAGLIVILNNNWQGTVWELIWRNDTFILLLVCINLLLNYVFARSTLPLEKVKQNE